MTVKSLQLLSIMLTAICLVPAGAHLFELPGKIALPADAYLTVQQIYRGWALFGVPLLAAIICSLALAWASRSQPTAMWLALGGGLLIVASLVLFFIMVFPANQATANWTSLPAAWEALRVRWEYGHATNAVLTLLGLLALVLSALTWTD